MPILYKNQQRVLFAHIPKNAGTSLYVWFADNGWQVANLLLRKTGVGPIFKERFGIIQCQLEGPQEKGVSPQHAVAETYKKWGEFTSGFCIVRHPLSRFISEVAYDFRLHCYNRNIQSPTLQMARDYIQELKKSIFEQYRQNPKVKDNHIRPQVDFVSEITRVLYYEGDWQEWLKEKYALQGWPPMTNRSQNSINFAELIDNEFRRMILEFYQQDLEYFGYPETPEDVPQAANNPRGIRNIIIHTPHITWQEYLPALPYAKAHLARWTASSIEPEYEKALNSLLSFLDIGLPPDERLDLLKQAKSMLDKLFEAGDTHVATIIGLIRTSCDLGRRKEAASLAGQLLKDIGQGKTISMDRPFVPPISDYDERPVKQDLGKWLSAAIMEAFEKHRAYTSYRNPKGHLGVLNHVCKLPDASIEMQRRLALCALKLGKNVNIQAVSRLLSEEEHLNADFWSDLSSLGASQTAKSTSNQPKEVDVYIISYPKSGRTWVRALLGKYLSLRYDLPEEKMLETELMTTESGLLKTAFDHDGSSMLAGNDYRNLSTNKNFYSNKHVILIGRDIRDTLVSAYFQATKRINVFNGPISDFLRSEKFGVYKILTFYNIWNDKQNIPKTLNFFRYEDLHYEPQLILKNVLQIIGELEPDLDLVQESIQYCSFDNLKKMEAQDKFNNPILKPKKTSDDESYKLRKGKVGSYKEYLTQEDQEFIDGVSDELGFEFEMFENKRIR